MAEDKIHSLRLKIKKFVLSVIVFAKEIPKDEIGRIFLNQLLRAVTSIGANFEEAVEAESDKDIIHKLSVAKKEAKESKYWLGLIVSVYPQLSFECGPLITEADELVRIFATVIRNKSSHP